MFDGCIRIIALQLPQRFAIGRVLVGIDYVRRPVQARSQRFRQKTQGCLGIAAVGQQKVDGPAVLVDGPKQPLPLSVHPDARLVDCRPARSRWCSPGTSELGPLSVSKMEVFETAGQVSANVVRRSGESGWCSSGGFALFLEAVQKLVGVDNAGTFVFDENEKVVIFAHKVVSVSLLCCGEEFVVFDIT